MAVSPTVSTSPRSGAGVYDSAQSSPLLTAELTNFWRYRKLIRLLVTRDVLARYKRSLLGVWWTLLNPLLTMSVMLLVFSHIFHSTVGTTGVPFVVYLLSGVLLIIFLQQGVDAVAGSIVANVPVLSKVYVPAETFALSAGLAAAINLLFGIIPLLLFQIGLGVGVPWTIVLVPVPLLALLGLVVGLGLIAASVAVRFHDVLDLTRVLLLLIGYMTPVFYPLSIVPHLFRRIIEFNPVFYDLTLFRGLIYGGSLTSLQTWVGACASGAAIFLIGVAVFARSWRAGVAML